MNFKKAFLGVSSRILRFAGLILIIYISMVFYLALIERRNAYPRAITHNEAEAAIKGKAQTLSCTLSDGTLLEGFSIGEPGTPTLLYYPDADEDAAQFLAEVEHIDGLTLTAFNYRGSANNKGTPSSETFVPDSKEIFGCVQKSSGREPQILAGRGTGAILASLQKQDGKELLLIDPVLSIAEAIANKYRFLYPKFLIRAKEAIPTKELISKQSHIVILLDRKSSCDRAHTTIVHLSQAKIKKRENKSLKTAIEESIFSHKKTLQSP